MARTYKDGRGPERGAGLLRLITQKNHTPASFAQLSGISEQTIHRMINGGSTKYGVDLRFVRADTAKRLATALIRTLNIPFVVVTMRLALTADDAARWAAWTGVTIPPEGSDTVPNALEIVAPRGVSGVLYCSVPCRVMLASSYEAERLDAREPRVLLVREASGKLETTLTALAGDEVLGVVTGISLGLGVHGDAFYSQNS